jgi:tetratricopeptide (TPR) repeat protein
VRAVLTSRLLQRGDRLSISTELVDVGSNRHLWGEQYDRPLADLIAVQEEISKDVTNQLRARLTGGDEGAPARRPTQNAEAYQLYLKGRFHWNKRNAESFQTALGYFQKAIGIDPNYALAHAGLADCYVLIGAYGNVRPEDAYPQARAAAMRALELDDTLAEAHASLGRGKIAYDWDWAGARREFDRALALNPNYATAHYWYSYYWFAMGRLDEAARSMRRALDLDPLSLNISAEMGRLLLYQRQYDAAIEQERKTLEMDPNFLIAQSLLAAAYLEKGMYDEVINAKGSEVRRVRPIIARAYLKSGKRREALKAVEDMHARSTTQYVPTYSIALVYAAVDDKERAFEWLERSFRDRSMRPEFMRVDPFFDDLRPDPRFQDLLRRAGLPQ